MKRILILCDSDDCFEPRNLPLTEADAVVVSFCASPEYLALLASCGARQCWSIKDLNLNFGKLIARAYSLTRQFVFHCPTYRGVNVLESYETELANALFVPLVMAAIDKKLQDLYGTDYCLDFLAENDGCKAMQAIKNSRQSHCEIGILKEQSIDRQAVSKGGVLWKLLAEARADRNWNNALWSILEHLDQDFGWRARFDRNHKISSGGALFFSSYVNYSRALLAHSGTIGPSHQWLIANHSARKALPPTVDPLRLWQFSLAKTGEHDTVLQAIQVLRAGLPSLVDDFPLRAAFAQNSYVDAICSSVMKFMLAQVDMLHNALDATKPDSVWVANQWGAESCLIQAARSRGIQVTQVQHAIMESYFSCAPIYSNEMIVWDEMWKRFVPQSEQGKLRVQEIACEHVSSPSISTRQKNNAKMITFFSSAREGVPLWNQSVLLRETITLLKSLVDRGHKAILRVHPRDRMVRYIEAWRQLYGIVPADIAIDKDSPLPKLLAKTDIGIMSFSTTVLNCRACSIPVSGMGWYEFMLKDLLSGEYVDYYDSIDSLVDSIGKSCELNTACDTAQHRRTGRTGAHRSQKS